MKNTVILSRNFVSVSLSFIPAMHFWREGFNTTERRPENPKWRENTYLKRHGLVFTAFSVV